MPKMASDDNLNEETDDISECIRKNDRGILVDWDTIAMNECKITNDDYLEILLDNGVLSKESIGNFGILFNREENNPQFSDGIHPVTTYFTSIEYAKGYREAHYELDCGSIVQYLE